VRSSPPNQGQNVGRSIPDPITVGYDRPTLSIIVPVHNSAAPLAECLRALKAAENTEIIVVDDASTDDSAAVAVRGSARVIRLAANVGPAAARNHGASQAKGEILLFVDADVVVAPGVAARVVRLFERHPDVAAIFGSYDDRPPAPSLVSQYRNLLHHFVHQSGETEASTFWAGCGAIRRAVFFEVGGFDAVRFPRPSIEDIELGYRLRRAGYRVVLDKALQGTHLKHWTLRDVLVTDVIRRALPWARLVAETGYAPDDLNLRWRQRVSAILALGAVAIIPLALIEPWFLAIAGGGLVGVLVLNQDLYRFFRRTRSWRFAMACFPLHLLYYLCGWIGCLWAWAEMPARRRRRARDSAPAGPPVRP
jgi:GT2 family glycosyltransferase